MSYESREQAAGVTLEGINLYFGKLHVLKNISLSIEPGEFFAFLGPSGCGKTTLLRLIAGFERAQAGKVYIGKKDVTDLPPWKRNVGMVFQNYALWPHMTVRKNVSFGLEEKKVPREEIEKRVNSVLELVDLLELADRRPSQLSGGQQQRVALARTLVVQPRVLLLDEPLSNLDAKLRVQMRRELRELQQKLSLTTIFVTHDQEEANTTADRIAVINRGIIQQIGSPMELYDQPKNLFVANFLGVANIIKGEIIKDGNMFKFVGDDVVISIRGENTPEPGPCSAVFRPQNLVIRKDTFEEKPSSITFTGKVIHREFLGNIIRYSVRAGSHVLSVDKPHLREEKPLEIGHLVTLQLKSDQIVFLKD